MKTNTEKIKEKLASYDKLTENDVEIMMVTIKKHLIKNFSEDECWESDYSTVKGGYSQITTVKYVCPHDPPCLVK
jgi:hypothetical protein